MRRGLRLDLRPEVVLPFKIASYLLGSVSVAPRETAYYLYSPVNPGDRGVSRELVEIRGNIGTTLSRIFSWGGPGTGAIRHVLEPELSYFFVPGVNQSSIPIMDGVDRVSRRNVVTFAVGNRFWSRSASAAASAAPDKEVESLNPFISNVQELGSLRLALGYNIAAARKGSDSLTDLDMNLRLTPINFLSFAFDGGDKSRSVGDHAGSGDCNSRGSAADNAAVIGSGLYESRTMSALVIVIYSMGRTGFWPRTQISTWIIQRTVREIPPSRRCPRRRPTPKV